VQKRVTGSFGGGCFVGKGRKKGGLMERMGSAPFLASIFPVCVPVLVLATLLASLVGQ